MSNNCLCFQSVLFHCCHMLCRDGVNQNYHYFIDKVSSIQMHILDTCAEELQYQNTTDV